MKLTLGWLKTHLNTGAGLDEIVPALVMLGLEVESIEDRAGELGAFTVARVVSAERHPDADRLKVCIVDTGKEQVQVVCGAPNARAGMLGVFAPVGTVIPRTKLLLKESTIRGVASKGMLCSAYEMGISEDHEGIIDLPPRARVGEPFAAVLGLDDPVLDVKVTPNRADCLGARGIARDLAAAGLGALRALDATPVPGKFPEPKAVHLAGPDEAACPLFVSRLVRNVKNVESPDWLKARLEAIGLRPISALVDITNFLTFDIGRPLHVFDADKLVGDLAVRAARPGEAMLALNGKVYELDSEVTVIADANGPQSLGGVIGGAATGCTAETKSVLIEAALFDPVRTAATGRRLGIQSDARYRFERGLDPDMVLPGTEIATRMILELCGGEPSEISIAGGIPDWHRSYVFRPERTRTLGGLEVPATESRRILEALGFTLSAREGGFAVEPPSWRGDIVGEADLVEEVLRVHGYQHIPVVTLPRETPLPRPALSPAQKRAVTVRRALASRGLVEAVTYSFIAKAQAELFGGGVASLTLVNPISADLDVMRPSILPSLVAAAQANADRGLMDAALFEVGPQYRDDTPEGQSTVAAGLRMGRTGPRHWRDGGRPVDALVAKADALAALAAAGAPVENLQVTTDAPHWYHPGRSASLRLGAAVLAQFGELHPRVAQALGAKATVAAFEVHLDIVPLLRAKTGKARPLLRLSPFQPVERDFAFVVDRDLPAEKLLRAARAVDKKLVAEVRLFDIYEGKGLPEGKKSLAIQVTLQPQDATLTEAALEGFSKKLVEQVSKATGGVLRS
ncbi:MAG TPA: phenylalanine--tRNA ligase subunit beta [Stellaceae bacterium]|nr:phenylalanine--tRNA ligase subunit beta [Stellaceae bacterium]